MTSPPRVDGQRHSDGERVLARDIDSAELCEAKDELLATVSHELLTPLTVMLSFLELIRQDGPLAEEQVEAFEVVDRHARRLRCLVTSLLLAASIRSNGVTLNYAQTDLVRLVRDAIDSAERCGVTRDVTVHLAAPDLAEVWGDPYRLSQVIDQLLSNAIKFARPGGEAWVTVRVDEKTASVGVADNGMGIPAADLPGLFDRFTRATNARGAAIEGLGNGLAIVKGLTELHGGVVSAESTEAAGARFCIEIPRGRRGDA